MRPRRGQRAAHAGADDLDNGTLVAPLGFSPEPNKLAIWVAPHLSRRPDTVSLVDWLTDELRSIER